MLEEETSAQHLQSSSKVCASIRPHQIVLVSEHGEIAIAQFDWEFLQIIAADTLQRNLFGIGLALVLALCTCATWTNGSWQWGQLVALLQFRQIDRVIAAFSQIIEDKRQTRSIEGKLHRDESEIRELHFCALYGSVKAIAGFVTICYSLQELQFVTVWWRWRQSPALLQFARKTGFGHHTPGGSL